MSLLTLGKLKLGRKRVVKNEMHIVGVMVRSIFAKITDAKGVLCFLVIKNTPAERKSPWGNHKCCRSTTSTTTVTDAAETFMETLGTLPFSWSLSLKNIKFAWHQ